LEFPPATAMIYISIDVSSIVGSVIIREYERTDGVNYSLLSSAEHPADFTDGIKTVIIAYSQLNCDYRVTLRTPVPEGADRQIPYRYGVEAK